MLPWIFIGGSDAGPEPEWLGVYSDATNASSYSFSVTLGQEGSSRKVYVGAMSSASANNITVFTINGVAAKLVSSFAGVLGFSLYSAVVPTGVSVSVDITYSTSQTLCQIGVWQTLSDNIVMLGRRGNGQGAVTTITATNLKQSAGGFILGGGAVSVSEAQTLTWTGADTPEVENESVVESSKGLHVVIRTTEDTIDDDFTISSASSATRRVALGSFIHTTTPPLVLSAVSDNLGAATTYTIPGIHIGRARSTRMVAIALAWRASGTRTFSSGTVGAASLAMAAERAIASGGSSVLYANVTADDIMDISITFSGAVNALYYKVYVCEPASTTPVDGVGNNAGATSVTASDIAISNGGFAIAAGWISNSTPTGMSWTGVDSVTMEESDLINSLGFASTYFLTTEDDTTRDFTFSGSTTANKTIAVASWL